MSAGWYFHPEGVFPTGTPQRPMFMSPGFFPYDEPPPPRKIVTSTDPDPKPAPNDKATP